MNGYTISCYIVLDVKKTDFAFLILKAKQGKDEKKKKKKGWKFYLQKIP